ncbi:MAG: phosphoribosylformylglycinamidine synthase subunit PurL [Dehalococcoidia bacterium]|nr:phosphoribosylformylglycinamidine synthase subunit PurL [Dehalococcoidia bacterium]
MTVDDHTLDMVAMSRDEYERLVDMLDREPTEVELGMAGALWSEHCGYKHSRPLFHHFPTEGPYVLTKVGEENAGAIDLGGGWCAVFKMESHNHPSALEPYQGAATGVGGILRDIFAMGMRPVALLDSLRFGPLSDPNNRHLFSGVVGGIGGYGNCIGVPTVGGEVQFDASYSGNPLVNAMCVGVGRIEHLLSAQAGGPGNPLLLVGADTGRDGIHGATFASVELDEGSGDRRPAVQVGDPFTEKLLMEACVELAEQHGDWIEGLQDLGAAGLTSSAVESAARAGTGIEIDVALVPRREREMSAYDVMLSESQERMLVIPKREHLDDVIALFRRWELHADVIGQVTDDGMATIVDGDREVARIRVDVLIDAPRYPPEAERPASLDRAQAEDLDAIADVADGAAATAALLTLLGSENIGSRRWIYRQYDHQVLNQTVVRPGGDAAVVALPPDGDGDRSGARRGFAVATDGNGRLVALEPRIGAQIAVAEAARNVVATGATPAAITDCLNFGNPEKPDVAYELEQSIIGLSEACEALGTPVVSGNASLYNETPDGAVMPTPAVGMLGVIDDVERHLTPAFGSGDTAVLLGASPAQPASALAGSEYLAGLLGRLAGRPEIDLDLEVRVQQLVLDAHGRGLLTAAHDCADGGLAVTVAESCLAGDVGFEGVAELDFGPGPGARLDAALFGEVQSRFVVVVQSSTDADALLELAAEAGVPATVLGTAGSGGGGDRIRLGPVDLALDAARDAYDGALERALAR